MVTHQMISAPVEPKAPINVDDLSDLSDVPEQAPVSSKKVKAEQIEQGLAKQKHKAAINAIAAVPSSVSRPLTLPDSV
jgi:hypothetical protein